MKRSKHSDSQIMAILKQAEQSAPTPELCQEHNIGIAHSISGEPNMAVWMPRLYRGSRS